MPGSPSNSERSNEARNSSANAGEESSCWDSDTCLYIGNLDRSIGTKELERKFGEFGELEYCYIVYEPQDSAEKGSSSEIKQSRGYGFAKYFKKAEADRAIRKMNQREWKGKLLRVMFSRRPVPREKTPGKYLGRKKASPPRHVTHRVSKRSRSRSHSRSSRRSSGSVRAARRRYDRSASRSGSPDVYDRRPRRRSYSSHSPRR